MQRKENKYYNDYKDFFLGKIINNKIKYIYFEHHYDNMIEKNYKFSDIHDLLTSKGFNKSFKIRMPFRKSFDYIYKKKIV